MYTKLLKTWLKNCQENLLTNLANKNTDLSIWEILKLEKLCHLTQELRRFNRKMGYHKKLKNNIAFTETRPSNTKRW